MKSLGRCSLELGFYPDLKIKIEKFLIVWKTSESIQSQKDFERLHKETKISDWFDYLSLIYFFSKVKSTNQGRSCQNLGKILKKSEMEKKIFLWEQELKRNTT